ncbi:hypothetical protein JD844_027371 [Phrynosoma platyrhinos]|uniref:SH3 domain-binding protein 2 n=1 Tax=Phrynosoma platyrhinos TaxID=52577 RepID=A0ABQ7SG68_PHRPL|nr:hypothetical protein JD844_027371 [Phrynosoma platyrhinos]
MGRASCLEMKARSFSGKSSVAVLPPPPPPLKSSLPDIRPDFVLSMKGEFPFNYQAEHNKKAYSTCQQASGRGPPVPPIPSVKKPISFTETCSVSASCLPQAHVLPFAKECGKLKGLKLSAQAPPPLPSSKPKLSQWSLNTMNVKEPRKQDKPGLLISKALPNPQVSRDKPPVPVSKPEKPFPSQRSSPDGQSFRNSSLEKPALPSKSKLSGEDSDDDYEKVELPNSVFVNTSDSLEVESQGEIIGIRTDFAINFKNTAEDHTLDRDSKFYLEADVLFMSLGSLVEYYSSHVLPGHNNLILTFPYGYSGPR